jgi:hypothetical protein
METPATLDIHPDNAVVWHDDKLYLLDQRVLPTETGFVVCNSAADTAKAIKDMVVRGAPAIGITAAYGVVLAARDRFQADAGIGAGVGPTSSCWPRAGRPPSTCSGRWSACAPDRRSSTSSATRCRRCWPRPAHPCRRTSPPTAPWATSARR